MWSTPATLIALILSYCGTSLLIFTALSTYFLSNGSAAVELAGGGDAPSLRSYEPVFYNPSEFLSQHRRKKREIRNSESLRLNIASKSRDFNLHLSADDSVFHPEVEIENSEGSLDYDTSRVLVGHLEDEPGSLAHGVLSEDGYFDGTIYSGMGSEYYLEPTKRYSSLNANASPGFIYEKNDIIWPDEPPVCASHKLHLERKEETLFGAERPEKLSALDPNVALLRTNNRFHHNHTTNPNIHDHHLHHHHHHDQNSFKYDTPTYSLASSLSAKHKRSKRYIIDPRKRTCMLYLQADHLFYRHFGSEEAAINMMARHIQRVNEIYRTTDFDGDGVPDDISFMIKRIKVHTKNHTLDPTYRYNGEFQVIKFLELFSEGDYDQFCLAYMFTFRDFEGGTLGLAWTGDLKNAGGVCERKGHFRGGLKSLNTGIITLLNYGKVVLPAVSFVTLAHEVGHNFGSPHDPEGEKECTPGGREGNYIMYARATAGDQKNNNRFSPCSLRSILPVLNSKARGTHGCFVEPQAAICGNREVEEGEECDCGWEEDCAEPCCWPMKIRPARGEKPCTLKFGKDCSPSQGPCCTANCTLKIGEKCRDDNGCRHSAFCDGYMPNCPPSIHKPNKTICHEEQSVCFMGECTGSICLAYGLESCQCTPEPWESTSKYCELCCKLPGEGQPCISSYQWNEPPFDVPNLYSKPGSPCKNYTGYCDAYHVCREVDPSGPLATLRNLLLADEGLTAIADWIDTHWYAVLCFFVLLILMMVLTAKLCGKRAKQRLRKITVMHSNVEAIQIERSYWDEQGEHVVHPMAIRKKIPIRKKVREKKNRKNRNGNNNKGKGDRPGRSVTGTLFKRKGRGERSKMNGHFVPKTEHLSPGEHPSNLNGDVQSPSSPTQSFNLVNLQAPNNVVGGPGDVGTRYPPPTSTSGGGGLPLYPNYMLAAAAAAETTNGMIGGSETSNGNGKLYNHNSGSCNNNIPSPCSSSSSGGFRTTAASPRSPVTPGDNINDPLCAALVNHEPKTVILPAAGVRRKRNKHQDKKDKNGKGKSSRNTSSKRIGGQTHHHSHNHSSSNNHHLDRSPGISKRRSVKATTKDNKHHHNHSHHHHPSPPETKLKKRIQVVFSPPFSFKVMQVVTGKKGESTSPKNLTKGNGKGGSSRDKDGNVNHSPGKNSGNNNQLHANNSSSPNGNSKNVNVSSSSPPTKSKETSEVPKPGSGSGETSSCTRGASQMTSNGNIPSVKNDLSANGAIHNHHHHKSNGAININEPDQFLLSNSQMSKSSDNLASSHSQKISNTKSVNNHHQQHPHGKPSEKELRKSKSSSNILVGANKNITSSSTSADKERKEASCTDVAANPSTIIENFAKSIDKGKESDDNDIMKGIKTKTAATTQLGDNECTGVAKESNNKTTSNHNIKSKVKSSGSFLQRRKQNLKVGRSGEKSELRVLIPPSNQEEDEINSPNTPMS